MTTPFALTCSVCQTVFMSTDRRERYCSDVCRKRKQWLKRGTDLLFEPTYTQRWCWKRTCRGCGDDFLTEDGRVWYCGSRCKEIASLNGAKLGVIEICPICETEFVKVHKSLYCSDECRAKAKQG